MSNALERLRKLKAAEVGETIEPQRRREYFEELDAEVHVILKAWLEADKRGDVAEMRRLEAEHVRLNTLKWELETGQEWQQSGRPA